MVHSDPPFLADCRTVTRKTGMPNRELHLQALESELSKGPNARSFRKEMERTRCWAEICSPGPVSRQMMRPNGNFFSCHGTRSLTAHAVVQSESRREGIHAGTHSIDKLCARRTFAEEDRVHHVVADSTRPFLLLTLRTAFLHEHCSRLPGWPCETRDSPSAFPAFTRWAAVRPLVSLRLSLIED